MRKLTFLIIALLLVRYGVTLFSGDPLPAYALRDGLIMIAAGLLIFIAYAAPWPLAPPKPLLRQWPLPGRFLVALGMGFGVAAALWIGVADLTAPHTNTARLAVQGLWLMGLITLLAGALWPGAPTEYPRPRYRWEVDAGGRQVRRALTGRNPAHDTSIGNNSRGDTSRRGLIVILGVTIVAALVVRFAQLTELPANCMGSECDRALLLTESLGRGTLDASDAAGIADAPDTPAPPPLATSWTPQRLVDLVSALFFRFTQDGLLSLRLAAAVFALALLPAVYGAARIYTRAGGAAAAVIFLALSPWHLWTARLSHEWIAVPVFVAWTLWAANRALRGQAMGWWAAVGIGLGALLIEAPELRFMTLAWALLIVLLGSAAVRRAELGWSAGLLRVALIPAALLTVALPGLAWQSPHQAPWMPGAFQQTLRDLPTALIQPNSVAPASSLDTALYPPLACALALLGMGYLLRHGTRMPAFLLLSSLALWTIGALTQDWRAWGAAGVLLPLLPLLVIALGIATDNIFHAFQTAWRPLIPIPRAFAAGLSLVLILAAWHLPATLGALDRAEDSIATSVDVAMGQYLAECLNTPADTLCSHPPHEQPPQVFVPAAVLDSASTRLLTSGAPALDRVHALDISRDLLPRDARADQARVYFVALENQQLIELLQQIYPEAEATAPPTEAGPTLFAVFRVAPDTIAARQGLQGAYAQGNTFVVASEADLVRRDGPLRFDWTHEPPLAPPFTVAWEGSLLVPEAGTYEFRVEGYSAQGVATSDASQPLPPLSLQLDGQLVLDTSLDLTAQSLPLAQGPQRLRLYLRADGPAESLPGFHIRWRPPGGEFQEIPRALLYSPPLPQIGLIGSYYADDQWQGELLTRRKDLLLEPGAELSLPYSVRWQGQIAATRAGEYLFSVAGDGLTQLLVDGRYLLDYAPDRANNDAVAGFVQAGIYLQRGWHPIEIRHAPRGTRNNLNILWQPPGSGPELLRSRYLLPRTDNVSPGEVALPALPELWDARLGDDTFALTYMLDLVASEVALPPTALPALPVEQIWQFARCGAGPDQLNAPHGVALDVEAGRVYVADTGNQRVAVFNLADGTPLTVYTDERLAEPTDIAIRRAVQATTEPVTEATAETSREANGEAAEEPLVVPISPLSPLATPASAATPSSPPEAANDASAPAPEIAEAHSTDVRNQEIYVLDAVAHPIFALDVETGALSPIESETSLFRPRGFHVDEHGVFWVADTGGARVVALTPDGQLLTQSGGHGSALGRGQPVDVVTANGVPWAIAPEEGRLWQLETLGSIPAIQRVNTIDGPHLTALPNGSFLLTDPMSRAFTLHAPSGEPLRRFVHAGGPDGEGFVHPTGIAAAQAQDDILIAVADSSACGLSLWRMAEGS